MSRAATSPLIAELVLFFIVIIVAIPVGGFVFGTMGDFTKTADVSINYVVCVPGADSDTVCTMTMNNLGTANAALKPSSYLLIFYGHSTAEAFSNTCRGATGDVVAAGSSLVVSCHFSIQPGQSGARFTGWVAIQTGQELPFAGSF